MRKVFSKINVLSIYLTVTVFILAGCSPQFRKSPLAQASAPTSSAPSKNKNYFVYSTNTGTGVGDGSVTVYSLEPVSGTLKSVQTQPVAADLPWITVVHPNGKFAYVVSGTDFVNPGVITTYSIDQAQGTLRLLRTTPSSVASSSMAIDPKGGFLYVGSGYSQEIRVYSIDPTTGILSPVQTQATTEALSFVSMHPSGKFLLATQGTLDNVTNGALTVFRIDPTLGTLSLVDTKTLLLNPMAAAADASGDFVVVVDLNDFVTNSTISVFRIDQSSGILTLVDSKSVGAGAWGVGIDPTGRFVYSMNYLDRTDSISVFSLTPGTGQLVPVQSVALTEQVDGISFDASGKFAFASNLGQAGVASTTLAFSIDQRTSPGSLTPIQTLPSGFSPNAIITVAIDAP